MVGKLYQGEVGAGREPHLFRYSIAGVLSELEIA
jgi:hypothetical protein